MKLRCNAVLMGLISVGFSLIGSTLLYIDVVAWPPPTLGLVWMYHTDLTGIT